jgi:asparagine synthase (glutamine-hydrolysing)
MCGLVAFFRAGDADSMAARGGSALDDIRHRGPDAAGEWREGDVFLGHRRLSIIDLKTGQQPMHSGDGRFVVVFNGEIYNFRELRDELVACGSSFRTRSDTEVILEGYRRWGNTVVERLNGMFAFVLWDRERRVAMGARDRLGIKPLCWTSAGGGLTVTSTLEPFRRWRTESDLDPIAVRDLMTFDYIPAPRTIWKNIHKLEPGSRFEWHHDRGEIVVEPYWSPPMAAPAAAVPELEEVEELLDRSIARQMISDVPVGAFLSGGIDSSLVVAMMARHASTPVKTYTVSFREQGFDESAHARRVAEEFSTEHHVLEAEELGTDGLRTLIQSLDEPFCDPAFVPLYALARATRAHVKVALCGDGADEVFGGYGKYLLGTKPARRVPMSALVQSSLKAMPWRPRGVDHVYGRTLSSRQQIQYHYSRYGDFPVFRKDLGQLFAPDLRKRVRIEEFFEPWDRHAGSSHDDVDTDVLMRVDLRTYLSENCLVKTDRASMLSSLEVRVPFLDEMIVDRVVPLPAAAKIGGGQLKALLQPLARRLLPRDVWDRPKHGFDVPIDVRMSTTWKPLVDEALAWGERHLPVFNYEYLRRVRCISRRESGVSGELWNPVVFLTWMMGAAPVDGFTRGGV